jgi:hypothetical protein
VQRRALALVVFAVILPIPAFAQTTTTPVFLAPYRAFDRTEFGVSLSDPGAGYALEGFYRFASGSRYDFGFRGGFQNYRSGDTRFLAGVDFRTRVIDHSDQFPLDGAFTAGIGGSFGNGQSIGTIPIGVSFGRRIQLEDSNVEFVPYFHPVLGPEFGDVQGRVVFSLGLGTDIRFSRRFELRVSGALGDYSGIGISAAFER